MGAGDISLAAAADRLNGGAAPDHVLGRLERRVELGPLQDAIAIFVGHHESLVELFRNLVFGQFPILVGIEPFEQGELEGPFFIAITLA